MSLVAGKLVHVGKQLVKSVISPCIYTVQSEAYYWQKVFRLSLGLILSAHYRAQSDLSFCWSFISGDRLFRRDLYESECKNSSIIRNCLRDMRFFISMGEKKKENKSCICQTGWS